jgi:DnaK suppressor protein
MDFTPSELELIKKRIGEQICQCAEGVCPIPPEYHNTIRTSPSVTLLDRMMAFRTSPWFYEIRAALRRIEEGSYGTCLMCKASIPFDFLARRPTARLCLHCRKILKPRSLLL